MRKGFTLIELLVVIAIVAVLAVVVVRTMWDVPDLVCKDLSNKCGNKNVKLMNASEDCIDFVRVCKDWGEK